MYEFRVFSLAPFTQPLINIMFSGIEAQVRTDVYLVDVENCGDSDLGVKFRDLSGIRAASDIRFWQTLTFPRGAVENNTRPLSPFFSKIPERAEAPHQEHKRRATEAESRVPGISVADFIRQHHAVLQNIEVKERKELKSRGAEEWKKTQFSINARSDFTSLLKRSYRTSRFVLEAATPVWVVKRVQKTGKKTAASDKAHRIFKKRLPKGIRLDYTAIEVSTSPPAEALSASKTFYSVCIESENAKDVYSAYKTLMGLAIE